MEAARSEIELVDTPERRPYTPPRLTVHGDAKTLTANLETGASDGAKGGSALDL